MSNAKHTAGPWKRDRYGALLDSTGRPVHFRSVTILCAGDGMAEAEANTDLIAAAPELLDALQKCMAALSYYDNNLTIAIDTGVDLNAQVVLVAQCAGYAALAKATGEPS